MVCLGVHDVGGEVEHILGNLLIGDVVEIVGFVPNLIGISQRYTEQSLAACFKRNDVLARGEYDLANGDHALLANGLPDDRERLLTDLPVWGDVVGIVQVQFVDLVLRNELVDIDGTLALDGNGFELFGIKLYVIALAHFIALDNVCGIQFIACFGIDLAVLDPVAGFLVKLMEADFFYRR